MPITAIADCTIFSPPLDKATMDDLFMVLAHAHSDNWLDFYVVPITGREEGGRLLFGDSPDLVHDPRAAEPYARGHVKWDGCLEVDADAHLCGQVHVRALLDAIDRTFDLAAEHLPHFDRELANYTPKEPRP